MKKTNFLFMVLHLILLSSCEDDIEFKLDIPIEFKASKGIYVDEILLQWNNPPKVTQIEIFRFDSLQKDYKSIGFSTNSSYIDSIDFIPNAKYYYKIRAYNSSEEISDFTNYDYGYVSSFESPSITSVGYGVSESDVKITWNLVNGADNYSIFRSENNEDFQSIGTTDTNFWNDHMDLEPGKTYYYKVQALNSKLNQANFSQVDSGYVLESYRYKTSFGSFEYGLGIEFDSDNNVYVSDNQSNVIKVYGNDYSFKNEIVTQGQNLSGLAWSSNGHLIAVSTGTKEILKIDMGNNTISSNPVPNATNIREVITDTEDNIYVTDLLNNEVVKLNELGKYVSKWKTKQANPDNSFYTTGLELQNNRIIVGGVNSSEYIEVYSTQGNFITQWRFTYPVAYISQDSHNNLFFASYNDKVIKTDKNGKILALIGHDKLSRCESVNVNSEGVVFASDEHQPNQIHVFTKVE